MLLERLYDDLLAQASYLLAAEGSDQCIAVDPHRDISVYLEAAARRRVRIVAVAETHIHADFLSGARALAREVGAQLILSGEGWPDWQYRLAPDEQARLIRDGDVVDIGELSLRAWHTPGHTPEHITFIVADKTKGEQPVGMISGDFVFAGDVGRPDLLERAANEQGTMEVLARALFHSLRGLYDLQDYLQLWPGHGAGSACGRALDSTPSTTLGYERLVNWAFQIDDEAEFVREVLGRQSEPPRYFARMKRLNRDGPPSYDPPAALPMLSAPDLSSAITAGNTVIDIRPSRTFANAHIPGTLNIPLGGSFVPWAGTLLPDDTDIVIISDAEDRMRAARRALALIGIDRVRAWATLPAESSKRRSLDTTGYVEPKELLANDDATILDVRGAGEWKTGHLRGATHIYLGDLPARAAELPRERRIVVHCQSGTRASIAASILRARGFTNVQQLDGGFAAWERAGLPVERDASA